MVLLHLFSRDVPVFEKIKEALIQIPSLFKSLVKNSDSSIYLSTLKSRRESNDIFKKEELISTETVALSSEVNDTGWCGFGSLLGQTPAEVLVLTHTISLPFQTPPGKKQRKKVAESQSLKTSKRVGVCGSTGRQQRRHEHLPPPGGIRHVCCALALFDVPFDPHISSFYSVHPKLSALCLANCFPFVKELPDEFWNKGSSASALPHHPQQHDTASNLLVTQLSHTAGYV